MGAGGRRALHAETVERQVGRQPTACEQALTQALTRRAGMGGMGGMDEGGEGEEDSDNEEELPDLAK